MFNYTNRKNSVCYGCTVHTSNCRKTCPYGTAEAQRNEAERRRRLASALAEYNGNRGTSGQIVYGRGK